MPEEWPASNETVVPILLTFGGSALTTIGGTCRGLTRLLRTVWLSHRDRTQAAGRAVRVTWTAKIVWSEMTIAGAFDRNYLAFGIDEPNACAGLDRTDRRDRNRKAGR